MKREQKYRYLENLKNYDEESDEFSLNNWVVLILMFYNIFVIDRVVLLKIKWARKILFSKLFHTYFANKIYQSYCGNLIYVDGMKQQ